MKLSVASLAASDFGHPYPTTAKPALTAHRAGATSLYDEDEDVPTTLLRPRRKESKARTKSRSTAAHV